MADQQLTSLLPKEYDGGVERKPFAGPSRLIPVLIALLILAALVYGGLVFYEKYYLQKQLNSITLQGQQLNIEVRIGQIKDALALDKKMDLLRQLLGAHIYFSQFFNFLEKNTENKIFFNQFSADANNLKVELAGKAASYSDFAMQIKALSNQKGISGVDFSSLSLLPDGKLSFKTSFSFDKSILFKK